MLHINNLSYRIGPRVLFDATTVAVNKGERVGLVGRNGSGKTTLLRLLSGEIAPDQGEVGIAGRGRIGRVAQEAPGGQRSLLDTVLAADEERTRLLLEAETAKDPHRIADIHERLATIKAESAPARAARILAGLGFDQEQQLRPCAEFSGGWRMRVALASLLFSEPDLLLLDEPTNHLDLEATLWLEGYLKSYPGTLLLISHDRDLLNRVVQKIIHLEAGRLTLYNGNYDTFERTRRERLEHEAASNTKIMAQRRHMQAFVDRFRYTASKARQAQSRLKALEKLQPIVTMIEDQTTSFDFPRPVPLSSPLIAMDKIDIGYAPGQPVLKGLDLRFDMDDRIALLGANGNGKSTLVRMLAGRLKPLAGKQIRSPKLKIGYFAQDQAEELDLDATPIAHMERLMPMQTETRHRAQLGRFGLQKNKAETKVGSLSGGEKARLLFALMSREAPQLLLLDEPTNHLDVDAREALVQALSAYDGAVVLVTHDPHLIELVADRLWLVKDGTVTPYDGDMQDYRRLLLEQRRQERSVARQDRDKGKEKEKKAGVDAKTRRREAAAAREAVAHLRRSVKEAEKRIEALQTKVAALEAKLANPEIYEGPTAKLMKLQLEHKTLKDEIEATEENWLAAQQKLESA